MILLAISINKPLLKQNKIKSILTQNVKYLLIIDFIARCQCLVSHLMTLVSTGEIITLVNMLQNWFFRKDYSYKNLNSDYVADYQLPNQLTFVSQEIYFSYL